MGMLDDEKYKIEDLQLRVLKAIDKKIDRGLDKNLITADEAKKLEKAVEKALKKHKNDSDWYDLEHVFKSFEIAKHLFQDAELGTYSEELELLNKIEKA